MPRFEPTFLPANKSGSTPRGRAKPLSALNIAYSATVFGLTGLVFWMPQIIKQFKVADTIVGLLSTIPYIIGAIVMCWWAARSDAKKERFWHFIVPSLMNPGRPQ